MKFYSNFQYQYTKFSNSLRDAINATVKSRGECQLAFIYSIRKSGHVPVRTIVNGRVYGLKHARKQGYKSIVEFGKQKFRSLQK